MTNPLYLVECSYGRHGNAFRETDRDSNSRKSVIELIRSGEVMPIKVLEVIEPCEDFPRGSCLDVTAELIAEAGLPEVEPQIDSRQAALWDYKRDLRKHEVV